MPKRNLVLLAAVVGLAAFLCMMMGFSIGLGFGRADGGISTEEMARRRSVAESMQTILPAGVESADSPELAEAVERLHAEDLIAWVWVVDPRGDIRQAWNGPAQMGESVYYLSKYEEDLIFAVEPQRLDPVTELELRLAMALRREGEHNDMYGHMVRAIPGPDGEPAAFVGVTFEAVDTTPGFRDVLFLIVGAVGFAMYWLGLPLWTVVDARAGGLGRSALLWGLFVLVANAAGLTAYLLVRHRNP
jgi:hypothetical protein